MSGALAAAALLPVALLSLFAYHLASTRMQQLVASSNSTAASMTSELVRSDLARMIDMARALSAQPGMVAAVQHHDADAVRQRLKATFNAINRPSTATADGGKDAPHRIDRSFVTDPSGVEWSDYPNAPESIGKNFSDRDWFRGVSSAWQPYLSNVYLRNAQPQILIVAMAAPVFDPGGKVIGIIVFQMPLAYLSEVLKPIHVGQDGLVYVVDGHGVVAAHPRLSDLATRSYTEPGQSAAVQKALAGKTFNDTYRDPITDEPMVAAFSPIAVQNGTWAAIAQQSASDVNGPIRRLGLSIATAGAIMAMAMCWLVSTLRRASLRDRRLSEELETKRHRLEVLAAELEQKAVSEHAARIEAQTAHETLRQAQGRLVQSEKLAALGQLVAGVAHEINNPLAFVVNNVAVLQRDLVSIDTLIRLYQSGDEILSGHSPELMRRIQDLAEEIDLPYTLTELAEAPARSREGLIRIQQIVKDLRDFARQNAIGDVQPDADINAGIESTLNIARGMAKKHQVELVSDLCAAARVTCSPGKINQVILNLISNAVHASPAQSQVTVRTRSADGGIVIEVIDHGTGIDTAIRGRIFDPFFTTKPQGEGTGLGLSISHGIVSDHGGSIDANTTPGGGTTFRVFLPTHPATDTACAMHEAVRA